MCTGEFIQVHESVQILKHLWSWSVSVLLRPPSPLHRWGKSKFLLDNRLLKCLEAEGKRPSTRAACYHLPPVPSSPWTSAICMDRWIICQRSGASCIKGAKTRLFFKLPTFLRCQISSLSLRDYVFCSVVSEFVLGGCENIQRERCLHLLLHHCHPHHQSCEISVLRERIRHRLMGRG